MNKLVSVALAEARHFTVRTVPQNFFCLSP